MNRLLFITAYPINNKTAGQNYSLQLLIDLSHDYSVDIIYWNYPNHNTTIKNIKNLNVIMELNTNSVLKTLYYSIIKCSFPLFTVRYNSFVYKWLKQNQNNYDMIYFDFSQTFIYSKPIIHPYKVMMCHDIIAQKYQRKKFSFLYNWLVRMTEKNLLKNGNSIFTFSAKDKFLIKSMYGMNSEIVPFYIGKEILDINLKDIEIENYFVFYGAWNRKENSDGLKWFIKEVYPSCKDTNIKIIGGALDTEIKVLISNYTNIEYLGFINNPYKIIAKSKAIIAPLFSGAGVKVKVIEALALGTPIIGTDIAFEGIDNIISDNRKFLIKANNKKDFIEKIKKHCDINSEEKSKAQKIFINNYNEGKFIEIIKSII